MKEDVIFYQKLMLNSWPAKNNILYKGWIVRMSEGVTRRANSVLPLHYTGDSLDEDITAVEGLYYSNNLRPIFQLSDYFQPEILEKELLLRGYSKEAETVVMHINLSNFQYHSNDFNVNISFQEDNSSLWYETLARVGNYRDYRKQIISEIINRIQQPTIKLIASVEEKNVGVVLGVIEKKCVGIYNLIVDKNYRRRGVGRSLMLQAIRRSIEKNLEKMYLSVEADNISAIRLYDNLSFKESFRYRYLVKQTE